MPQYMVTMEINKGSPLLPLDKMLGLIRQDLLPSVESLMALEAQGKVLTSGYPIGQRAIVFIIETDSREQLEEILEELPLSEVAQSKVTPLKSFEQLRRESR